MATWAAKPIEAYLNELRVEDSRDRRQAAAALGDENVEVRGNVARALGRLNDAHAVPAFTALHDPDPAVRVHATQALCRLGDRRAVAALIDALDDPDWAVRGDAAQALGDLGGARAVGPLIHLPMKGARDSNNTQIVRYVPSRGVRFLYHYGAVKD